MKTYRRILDTARANGYMPADTRGHWDYGVDGHKTSAAELRARHKENQVKSKAKTKERSAATRAKNTAKKTGGKPVVAKAKVDKAAVAVEKVLNNKWRVERNTGDGDRDTHKQYESVGNGV